MVCRDEYQRSQKLGSSLKFTCRETHHVPKIQGISEYKPTRSYASVYVRLFLTYVQYLAQKPGIFRYNRDMRGFYVEIQIIFATVESYVHGGFII